jgi:hypothetical protein
MIWDKGLQDRFFTPVLTVSPAAVADGNAQLAGAWGASQESDGEKYRVAANEASVSFDRPVDGPVLMRVRLGSAANALTERTPVVLEAGGAVHADTLCKARWIAWRIPGQESVARLTIKGEAPVRVYAVEAYTEKNE